MENMKQALGYHSGRFPRWKPVEAGLPVIEWPQSSNGPLTQKEQAELKETQRLRQSGFRYWGLDRILARTVEEAQLIRIGTAAKITRKRKVRRAA